MSAIVHPETVDPRILRSRASAIEAGRTLFLRKGYVRTTMDEIADLASISKRTLYNNFRDKEALFTQIVSEVIRYADEFAATLADEFVGLTAESLSNALHDLGRRLALAIMRPEVIALRRLLIGEAESFPELAEAYFDRAPGRVMIALAAGFGDLTDSGLLAAADGRRAAEQFAYLVAGAPLDRAILTGMSPTEEAIEACARDGVETFLARYEAASE